MFIIIAQFNEVSCLSSESKYYLLLCLMFILRQRHLLIWKLKQKVEASKISAVQRNVQLLLEED